MKNNCSLFFLITIILLGCNMQNDKDSSQNNIDNKINENSDSLFIEKDKDGKITSKCNYKQGMQHGLCQFYYNNGQVKEEGNFYFGKPLGTFKYYNEKGNIEEIREYQIVKDNSVINQILFFDGQGGIIKNKSNYIKLSMQKDTIQLGKECSLNIILEASYFKSNMNVVIGNFDAEYNLIDSLGYVKLEGKDFEVQYKFKAIKIGENVVRGIVKDYKKIYNSDTLQARRNIYFTKKYFVVG